MKEIRQNNGLPRTNNSKNRIRRNRVVGALLLVTILLFACLGTMGIPLAQYTYNLLLWNRMGSQTYTIAVDNQTYFIIDPDSGEHSILVRDGKAIGSASANRYTVDRLFQDAFECAISPFFKSCTISYNKDYGYPEEISMDAKSGALDCCMLNLKVLYIQIEH